MTAQPGINIQQVNGQDLSQGADGLPVQLSEIELLRENLCVSKAILTVLVGAFYPAGDPQEFIDAQKPD